MAHAAVAARTERVSLDLSKLIYLDAPGAEALQTLTQSEISILACSSFVAEIIRGCNHA